MNKPVYILASSAISPQHSFDAAQFLAPVVSVDNAQLYVVDQDYSKFISPVAIRRMSRLIKMGISAGMKCLQEAGVAQPDAIITGTSHGSIMDMEQFLKDMIVLEEGVLNPTYFIQSTYNSINGWLAVQTKSTCYNQTYVHRGFSFELALFDAQIMLQEASKPMHILAGSFDELTHEHFIIKAKRDYWKKEMPDSISLIKHSDTPGTIGGEGTAFFVLSNEQQNAACAIYAIQMMQDPALAEVYTAIDKMLASRGLKNEDIDILLCGMNGDSRCQSLFNSLIETAAEQTTIATFKQLCGEYETAASFALWLTNQIFSKRSIPEQVIYKQGTSKEIKNILICNKSMLDNVTLVLVRGV